MTFFNITPDCICLKEESHIHTPRMTFSFSFLGELSIPLTSILPTLNNSDMALFQGYFGFTVYDKNAKRRAQSFGKDLPLVVGCSIAHKPRPLHVIQWDASQIKNMQLHF